MAHRGQQTAGGTGGHSKNIGPLIGLLGGLIGGAGAASADGGAAAGTAETAADGSNTMRNIKETSAANITPKPELSMYNNGNATINPLTPPKWYDYMLDPSAGMQYKGLQNQQFINQQNNAAMLEREKVVAQLHNEGLLNVEGEQAKNRLKEIVATGGQNKELETTRGTNAVTLANTNANNTGALNAGLPPSEYSKYAPKLAEGRAGVLDILNQNNLAQGNIDAYALSPKTNPDVLPAAVMGMNQNYLAPAARNFVKMGIGDAGFLPSTRAGMSLDLSATGMVPPTTKSSIYQNIGPDGKPMQTTKTTETSNPYVAAASAPSRIKLSNAPAGNSDDITALFSDAANIGDQGDYNPGPAITPKPTQAPNEAMSSDPITNLLWMLNRMPKNSSASPNSMGTGVSRLFNPYGN